MQKRRRTRCFGRWLGLFVVVQSEHPWIKLLIFCATLGHLYAISKQCEGLIGPCMASVQWCMNWESGGYVGLWECRKDLRESSREWVQTNHWEHGDQREHLLLCSWHRFNLLPSQRYSRFLWSVRTVKGCLELSNQCLHSSKASLIASSSQLPMS